MKKIIMMASFAALFFIFYSQDTHAQVRAGVGAAFGSGIEQVGIQGDLNYTFANRPSFGVGAGFIYYFPKNNHNFYEINLNGSYTFYQEFMFKSYVYSGVNYARSETDFTGSPSITETAWGLNVGVGAEYDLGPVLVFGDLKYVVSKFDQAVFSIGLRLPF